MTDKERILMAIIRQLRSTAVLGPHHDDWEVGSKAYGNRYGGSALVHFAPWQGEKLEPGMLVVCNSSHLCDWTVSIIQEVGPGYAECLLRELGTNRLCRMSNEAFTPICNMAESDLWEGEQFAFAKKARKAFFCGDDYVYRYGGLSFSKDDPRHATILVREVYGGLDKPSLPFAIEIDWTPKTTIKAILQTMRDGGYGTRPFEVDEVALEKRNAESKKARRERDE